MRPMPHPISFLVLLLAVVLSGCTFELEDRSASDETDAPAQPDDDAGVEDGDVRLVETALCRSDAPDCPARGAAAGTLLCTARLTLPGDPEEEFRADLTYEGRPLVDGVVSPEELADNGGQPVTLTFNLGGLDFPNGTYRCELATAGVSEDLELEITDGPTEPLWGFAVCERDDTVELAPGIRVCVEDEPAIPEGATAVTCSAGVTPEGREIVFHLDAELDDGRIAEDLSLSLGEPDLGVAAANGTVDAQAFGDPSGDPLPNGDYVCRFDLGGEHEVEHPFRVG